MAIGPTLPPQAYTRETLTAAFNWLQSQPESVRKLATTPDALVGLYIRAQRYGNSNFENDAPVSSQNFMSNLKSLAEGLKQFEQSPMTPPLGPHMNPNVNQQTMPQQPPPPPQAAPSHQQPSNVHQYMTPAMAAHLTSQMQAQIPLQTPQSLPTTQSLRSQIQTLQQSQHAAANPPALLNDMSARMLQEVKNHLNLSSDSEALNMMLALAYKNLKNLLG